MLHTRVASLKEKIEGLSTKNIESLELLSQFRDNDFWKEKSERMWGTLRLIGQHSNTYFFPLPSCYLFEMKSLETISFYSPLIAKDGALTLLKFFFDNPSPKNESTTLIISDRLKLLAPKSWQNNVLTYKLSPTQNTTIKTKKSKILLLATMLGEKQCSIDYISKIFSEVNSKALTEIQEVYICSLLPRFMEGLTTRDQLAKYHSIVLAEITKASKIVPQFMSPTDIEGLDMSEFVFADLNEFSFYYADSYFYHDLYQRGAQALENLPTKKSSIAEILLSPFHKIEIFEPEYINEDSNKLSNLHKIQKSFFESKILIEAENTHQPQNLSFEHKLCSKAFEDFAFQIIKTISRND